MMNKLLLMLLCGCVLCACKTRGNGYIINGNITGSNNGTKVLLFDRITGEKLDSTVIGNEKFRLEGTLALPALCQLVIDKDGQEETMLASSFYLENAEISYSGHIDSLETYYWTSGRKKPVVKGSTAQDLYEEYEKFILPLRKKSGQLHKQYLDVYHIPAIDGVFNTDSGIILVRQMDEIQQALNAAQWEFVQRHSENIVGFDLAMQFLDGMEIALTAEQIDRLIGLITQAWETYPEKVAEFRTKAEKAKKSALGVKYQDIELINLEGQTVKLSDYIPQGKYVMLEFWASWCGPCRGEIPHLRNVYREYKDKGFEIVSVSIDQKKADWEKAVKEENMVWTQLCDPRGMEGPVFNQYNVTGVPTCIMLDKEGRIFKTGMRGAALDNVLREIYGNPQK